MWSAANMLQFPLMNHEHGPKMALTSLATPWTMRNTLFCMIYAYIYITHYIFHYY